MNRIIIPSSPHHCIEHEGPRGERIPINGFPKAEPILTEWDRCLLQKFAVDLKHNATLANEVRMEGINGKNRDSE
jgi:hypothetical protein